MNWRRWFRRPAPAPRRPYEKPRMVETCPYTLIQTAMAATGAARVRDLTSLGARLSWPCQCSTHQLARAVGPKPVAVPGPMRVH